MKVIKNPTDKKVRISVNGSLYEVEANDSIVVQDSVANRWIKIHKFLRVEDKIDSNKTYNVKNIPTETSDEVESEEEKVKESTQTSSESEEKPKKTVKKSSKSKKK